MSRSSTLLLVDDDQPLRESLSEQLALHEDFSVMEAASAAECLDVARRRPPDIILLDVGLPDMDGRELCKKLRREGVRIPILMLTAADSETDTIMGLDAGANDYIVKPFHFRVLLARLRAQLRHYETEGDSVFKLGSFEFRPASKMLVGENDKTVRLTEKESTILKHLCLARNQTVPRDVLLYEVWGYQSEVTTHTLETHIYRLRQKIEDDPANSKILLTDAGGYRLQS
jgi:DNA-binding response OmpR family regulator